MDIDKRQSGNSHYTRDTRHTGQEEHSFGRERSHFRNSSEYRRHSGDLYRRSNSNAGRNMRISTGIRYGTSRRPGRRGPGRAFKLVLAGAGIALLLLLLLRSVMQIVVTQPQGEYITAQEAANLAWLLADTDAAQGGESRTDAVAAVFPAGSVGMLQYSQWQQIIQLLPVDGYVLPKEYGTDLFRSGELNVLAADWYGYYDLARGVYDPQNRIQDKEMVLLAAGAGIHSTGKDAAEEDGAAAGGETVLSEEKTYRCRTGRGAQLLYRPLTAVVRDGVLYAVRSVNGSEYTLSNVWIMETAASEGEQGAALQLFFNDYEFTLPVPEQVLKESGAGREQVADLQFRDGVVRSVHSRTNKISGKLLSIQDNGAEIEGYGLYPFSDNLKVYRLYGSLKRCYTSDLRIGYDFTDFVIEDGKIEACLVAKEEKMENIRVLVKNSNYGGALHESLELQADCDLTILSGPYGEQTQTLLTAGETLTVGRDSGLFTSDRIRLEPAVLTGRITLNNVQRAQGAPSCHGSLELIRQEGGIAVVNELLLEEYLYAVVPSEMPSSYPLESLKAQAVCARTYAYGRLLHAGLPAYGAHVDDSAGFQVYNNISENVETTKAVKETKGQVLYFADQLAETYYYSTSCGYGTNTGVWKNSVPENFPYLQARAINQAGVTNAAGEVLAASMSIDSLLPAVRLTEQESFDSFIRGVRDTDFEASEAWYRWTYTVESLDTKELWEVLSKRYAASPSGVLVKQGNGSFVSAQPSDYGRVRDIRISTRLAGGVADELVIEGESGTVMIRSENNIRYALRNGVQKVIRQDGSEYNPSNMLPSAFVTIDLNTADGYVAGYKLTGGGFGHGVGMSQNGARQMAGKGCDSGSILRFFYEGSEVRTVY